MMDNPTDAPNTTPRRRITAFSNEEHRIYNQSTRDQVSQRRQLTRKRFLGFYTDKVAVAPTEPLCKETMLPSTRKYWG